MGWIFALPWADPEGFWLNVLAGVPFLVLDVVIITMLLPVTIQWWEERRWRETRLLAVRNVLNVFSDVSMVMDDIADGPVKSHTYVQLHKAMDALNETINDEIQTVLPVLSPDMARDVLGLRHQWKGLLTTVRHRRRHPWPLDWVEAELHLSGKIVRSLNVEYVRLRVLYASDKRGLPNPQLFYLLPWGRFSEVHSKIEIANLAKTGRKTAADAPHILAELEAEQQRELLLAEPVNPIIHRGLLNALRGKGAHPIWFEKAKNQSISHMVRV